MAEATIKIKEDVYGNVEMLQKLAATGEPFFILRAQDRTAAAAVRFWANEAEKAGVPATKVANARQCAGDMLNHRPRKMPD